MSEVRRVGLDKTSEEKVKTSEEVETEFGKLHVGEPKKVG